MATTGVAFWSQTAATNATADSSVGWAEGQAPSTVNDSARAMMASTAKWRDDLAGALTTGGTSTAYTLTTNQVFPSLTTMSGQALRVKFDKTCGIAPTLNVDGLNAKSIVTLTGTAVGVGAIKANQVYDLVYANGSSEWIMVGGTPTTGYFASGTALPFYQTAAPTGWTKSTTNNDKAMRVVSGSGGVSGGTTAFTSVFAGRTIAQNNLPATLTAITVTNGSSPMNSPTNAGTPVTVASGLNVAVYATDQYTNATTITNAGGGQTIDFAVQYIDLIICTKD